MEKYKINLQLFAGDPNIPTEPPTPTVIDLTGTSWLIDDVPSIPQSTIALGLNFTSNNTQFDEFVIQGIPDGFQIVYGSLGEVVYTSPSSTPQPAGWESDNYKTISITGGNGATNSTLISWLEANATQIEPEEKKISFGNLAIEKIYLGNLEVSKLALGNIDLYEGSSTPTPEVITDLTGTTWEFNDSIPLPIGITSYTLNFTSRHVNYSSLILTSLQADETIKYDNSVVYDDEVWANIKYQTISITGGTDATNSDLINWLQGIATQITN